MKLYLNILKGVTFLFNKSLLKSVQSAIAEHPDKRVLSLSFENKKQVQDTYNEEQEEMENRDFLREDDDPIFTPKEQNTVTPEQEDVPLDKTNDILKQINEYLDNEKKKL